MARTHKTPFAVDAWPEFTSVEPELEPRSAHPGLIVKAMEGMGASWTLAHLLAEEASQIALRVFLLDNSGSTCQADGHVLQKTHLGQMMQVPASRWDEIAAMAIEQAEWNAALGVRCEFVLLNGPRGVAKPKEGRDYVVVDPSRGDTKSQVENLSQLLKRNGPCGPTPLAQRIRQLTLRLKEEVKDGRRIMLSVVTDGIPTSSQGNPTDEFIRELRGFVEHLNAFVVIRLATDDEEVVKYYNRIDEELELPLDILDDLAGEAEELHAVGNGWFAYTPLLHRIREGGALNKLFDLLDERALKLPEIAEMLELLFRLPEEPPFPRCPEALYALAANRAAVHCSVFNGRKRSMTPSVDLKALKKALGLCAWHRWREDLLKMVLCAKGLKIS